MPPSHLCFARVHVAFNAGTVSSPLVLFLLSNGRLPLPIVFFHGIVRLSLRCGP